MTAPAMTQRRWAGMPWHARDRYLRQQDVRRAALEAALERLLQRTAALALPKVDVDVDIALTWARADALLAQLDPDPLADAHLTAAVDEARLWVDTHRAPARAA